MTISITPYSRFTHTELLTHLDERASKSPIIKELCNRLEVLRDLQEEVETNTTTVCEVCEAVTTIRTPEL